MTDAGPAPGIRKILSDDGLAAYRRDGFVVPRYRLPPADLAARSRSPTAGHHTRPLILARGTDRSGRNDFRRGHPAC